ncbi:MAG: T9SS type A sorting domain-containing protein [Ignavibacteria bacterium]|jgi:hypothetical protein|nr:T9SS type A sorting domain-containing protein [Ignavibacteria bacterium]MCU7521073.1 T9SS type A sorting domain-containing protein [Ignavibacteria bacterium]
MAKYALTMLILLVMVFVSDDLAQTPAPANGDYQSAATGVWEDPATWQKYNNGVWESSTDFPASQTSLTAAKINIQSGTTVTLTAPKTVRNLWLNGVLVTSSTNLLTVLPNYSITGGSLTAYVDGPVAAQVNSTAMRVLKFPVGKAGQGRPVEFTVAHKSTALTTFTAELIVGAPPIYTMPATIGQIYQTRYVRILKTGTNITSNAQIKLSYDTDDGVGNNYGQLRIAKNDINANWVDIGGIGTSPVTGTIISSATLMANYGNSDATGTIFALGSTITLPKITGNAGMAGVVLSYMDGTLKTVTTDAAGNYSISVPYGWSGTVTPALAGYNFTPQNKVYSNVIQDVKAENYTPASIYNDYRTSSIGNWEDPAIWEAFDGTNWIPSPNYPIAVTGTVTLNPEALVSLNSKLTILSGGVLDNKGILDVSSTLTISAGGVLRNEGTLENPNVGTSTSPNYTGYLYVYGTYEHAQNAGMAGLSGNFGYTSTTWYGGSTCLITGVIDAAPTFPTQTAMYSATMVWDCPNQTGDAFLNLNSSSFYTAGGITVLNSNSQQIYLFSGQGTNVRNIVVSGPNSKLTAFSRMSQGIEYLFFSYCDNLTVEKGGEFYICTEPGTNVHYASINIRNNLTVSSDSKVGTYSNPAFGGISYSRFVFGVNPNKTPHTINTAGLIPIIGMDDRTNSLNYFISYDVILNSPLRANVLDMSGRITSNGNLITIPPGGSITGGSKTGFTDGPIAFQVASASPVEMNFPLGKGTSGYFAKLNVTDAASELTTYTAEMITGTPPANNLFPYLSAVSSVRYFTISKSPNSGVQSAALTMNYDAADNISDSSLVRVVKNDGSGKWINLGGTGSAPGTGVVTSSVNFSDFSGNIFLLGKASSVPLGLVSYWKLDEQTSGSYADFLQVNNASGTTTPNLQGRVGSSQDFDGTTSKLTVPANPSLDFTSLGSFSVEMWFKAQTPPSAFQALISRSISSNGATWYVGVNPVNGKARFYLSGGGQTASLYGTTVTDNQWHHIAATRNGTTGDIKLYVDGALSATMNKSFSVDFASPVSKLEVGSLLGGSLLKGTLDELAFHNTELSASGILKHFQNGALGQGYILSPEPVITSSPVIAATVGVLYTYDVNATGTPAPAYSLTASPDGTMTIDPVTGVIRWTPSAAGTFQVSVKADNGLNPAAVQTFSITVAQAPYSGMISYWKLDEQTSGSYSDFKKINNAAGSSSPVLQGKVGGAQYFDGVTSKISVPASASLDFTSKGSFSLEAWFMSQTPPSQFQAILSRSFSSTGANWYMGINPTNGKARFYISGGGQTASLYGTTVTDNQWHHIAATRNGATGDIKLYVDGVLTAGTNKSFNVDFSGSTSKLEVGSFLGGSLLKGTLDEVAIHSAELSASEILQHFQNGMAGQGYILSPEPVITSSPVTAATVGELYSYDVNAAGTPAPTYSLTASPDVAMTIDPATGLIQWTPALAGTFQVSVKADNGLNPAAVQTFTITVAEATVTPAGLVSYWKLDEQTSGNYADFLQVNNASGTTTPNTQGKVASAQDFDGTTSKLTVPANTSLDFTSKGNFSVETWFKAQTPPPAFQAIISRSFSSTGANWYIGINPVNGKARFYLSGGGQTASLYGTTVTDNQWHHIAATRNGSTGDVKLYVDGVLSASMNKSFSVDFSSPASKLEIGSFLGASLLKGTLDELAFHNTELSSSEILKHFQNGVNGLNYWGQDGSTRTFKVSASPVFEKFSTSASENNVRLTWHTNLNVAGNFELERTSAGQGSWKNIALVSSEGLKDFEFSDKVPSDGKYSYRVKFISRNGGYAYSDVSDVEILPREYNLVQNYPNPFNPATTISYELPSLSRVNLTIYNMLGERVAELVNEIQSAGSYKQVWNASRLASGIYLLRMESRDVASERSFVRTLKMIMMK